MELSTERFQLADLIKSVRIEANGTPEAEFSLLEREVPEKAERGFPGKQAHLLLLVRVDPKFEPLVTPHNVKHTLVCKKSKRIPSARPVEHKIQLRGVLARCPFGGTPLHTLERHIHNQCVGASSPP